MRKCGAVGSGGVCALALFVVLGGCSREPLTSTGASSPSLEDAGRGSGGASVGGKGGGSTATGVGGTGGGGGSLAGTSGGNGGNGMGGAISVGGSGGRGNTGRGGAAGTAGGARGTAGSAGGTAGSAGGTAGGTGGGGSGGNGGGASGGCDSVCGSGETCVSGICRGPTSRWSTLGGDVHHSGFNANETGTPPLKRAWSVPLAGPMGLWPAVSDGTTVYVSEHGYFDQAIRMWALDPSDGHTVWTYNFGNIFGVGQATVDGGHVYIAQCNNGGGSFMYSFVASAGTLLWSRPIGAQWENYWAPLVTPTGGIYFDGGTYGGLYGLATASGAQLFFDSTLEQYDEWSPLYLDGKLYTFVEGNLRLHDLQTGVVTQTVSETWNWQGWSMKTSPVSDGEKIYLISPPNLYAFRVGQGNPDWMVNGAYSGMPAVANGVVYAISGGQLRANDASTGAILWTFAGDSALSYPPVVAGHFVYVASDAIAYGFDTTTQQIAWMDAPGGWPSIAGGQLYVAQQNGTLAAHALTP
jgi:PQQ-like domain